DEAAVLALIDEEADRISGREIDRVTEVSLQRRALQVRVRIAQDQGGGFAVGVVFRQEAGEDAAEFEIDVERPEAELGLESLRGRVGFVRDQDVDAEAFHPAVRRRAEAERVSLLLDELPV